MKTLVLVLALMVVATGACVAETVTFDLYQGWTLLAVPQVPFNPGVTDVFKTPTGAAIPTLDCLATFVNGSDFPYNSDMKDYWTGLLLGQGYWIWVEQSTIPEGSDRVTVQYDGVANGVPDSTGAKTDMWISLPGVDLDGDTVNDSGSWHMIGNPFNQFVDLTAPGAITFTNGTTTKTWAEACAPGPDKWVDEYMGGFVGSDLPSSYLGWDAGYIPYLLPAAGYWIFTYQPNLAMIVKADAVYVFE